MVSLGFECTQHLAGSLWGQDMWVADFQVLAVGPKCDACAVFRVLCLELYKPKGRDGFNANVFSVVRLIFPWFDLWCLCCV